MSQRISYKVTGNVQGVSFRYYTVKEAQKIGITGYVQNASDGSVIGEAQGEDSKIKSFVQFLNKGPSAASVSDVKQSAIEVKDGEKDFSQK